MKKILIAAGLIVVVALGSIAGVHAGEMFGHGGMMGHRRHGQGGWHYNRGGNDDNGYGMRQDDGSYCPGRSGQNGGCFGGYHGYMHR